MKQETAALVESLRARVVAVDEKVKAATTKPVVFYELDSTDPAKPWTAGTGSFVDELIARAGGVNLTTAAGIKDPFDAPAGDRPGDEQAEQRAAEDAPKSDQSDCIRTHDLPPRYLSAMDTPSRQLRMSK